MNQEFLDQLIILLDDFANTYEERDFLKMYRARLEILEHIETMNPSHVPDIELQIAKINRARMQLQIEVIPA